MVQYTRVIKIFQERIYKNMTKNVKKRDAWSSRAGFILASAGSAVGLGNLWKFPYVVGKNGGGAFVLVYLAIMFTVGLSVVIAEIVLGRATHKNVVGAYRQLDKRFSHAGLLCVITAFGVISFYSAVGGWTTKYMFTYIFTGLKNTTPEAYYQSFMSSSWQTVLFQWLFMLATAVIVYKGIAHGIERASKMIMPILLLILIILAVRSMTLPNAMEGVKFFLMPDFSKLTAKTVLYAMGQVFFSLSVGCGTLITYGSYMKPSENIPKTATFIPFIDTFIAMLGGFAILPAVFAFGLEPGEGPGLTFQTLPHVFANLPGGRIFGALFFVLLFFAAVTSSISMLEILVTYLTEEKQLSRKKAVLLLTAIILVLGLPCALSGGVLSELTIGGKTIFDLFDFTSSTILMPVGGLMMCIFIGYFWKPKNAIDELTNHGTVPMRFQRSWSFIIKFIAPIVIFSVIITSVFTG